MRKSVEAACLFPLGVVTGSLSFVTNFFAKQKTNGFSAVVNDSREWHKLGDIEASLLDDPLETELIGIGTSTFQDSGVSCPDSQWAKDGWQKECIKDPTNRSGDNANLFALYKTPQGRKEITDRLHKLNVNTFRLSIEWSQIEPQQGVWNRANLKVYIDLCKHLRCEGFEIVITLLHFSEPQWFHKLGSFEKEENIQYFVSFAEKVFPALTQSYQGRPLVEYFCTINEPAIDAFSRYVLGSFSPGFFLRFTKAGNFLQSALKAHCTVYEKLKQCAPPSVQVGIIHQYLRFIPTNFLLVPVVRYFTRLINEVPMNYFKTGTFDLKVPFLCNIERQDLPPKTDFVGLQYYVRPVIGLMGPTSYHEPMTQMPFREDPEGIFEAILETHHAFKAPVMITETGISTHDDQQRNRYMVRSLYAAREASKIIGSENLWGYLAWCFGDNLELNMGMKPQAFGAFALLPSGLDENPKPGMASFIKVAAAWQAQKEKVA